MFAQAVIYVVLFVVFVIVIWHLFGRRIVRKLSDPKKERESLKKKIKLLKELAEKSEGVEEEIEVTGQLGKIQKDLKRYEERLEEVEKDLL